jgi:hypothetical protein
MAKLSGTKAVSERAKKVIGKKANRLAQEDTTEALKLVAEFEKKGAKKTVSKANKNAKAIKSNVEGNENSKPKPNKKAGAVAQGNDKKAKSRPRKTGAKEEGKGLVSSAGDAMTVATDSVKRGPKSKSKPRAKNNKNNPPKQENAVTAEAKGGGDTEGGEDGTLPLTAKSLTLYADKNKDRTTKRQRTFRTSSWSGNEDSDGTVDSGALDEDVCFECGNKTDDYMQPGCTILICDTCEGEYHLKCVDLEIPPRNKWSCPACMRERVKNIEMVPTAHHTHTHTHTHTHHAL